MVGRYWIVLLASGCADFAGIGDPAPRQPDAPEVPCVVGGLDLCLFARPQTELNINIDLAIDTTRDCNLIIYMPPAPSVCVIYASNINISATVSANGTRALVLAASNSIDISGTVDVSAYRALGNTPAGANDPSCMTNYPSNYGGGAGGSFAGKGGNGGTGVGGTASNQGATAAPAVPRPANVRGGCAGGAKPGGGVWLAAGTEIRVGATGRVLANGAGGRGDFDFSSGGGGSGGMIRVAAPHLVLAGVLTANGGGGAEGYDTDNGNNSPASNGADGTIGTTRAKGGGGTSSVAGDGGAGSAGSALDGINGNNSTGTAVEATGGAGGGGAGFVHLVSESIDNMATISPPPST